MKYIKMLSFAKYVCVSNMKYILVHKIKKKIYVYVYVRVCMYIQIRISLIKEQKKKIIWVG